MESSFAEDSKDKEINKIVYQKMAYDESLTIDRIKEGLLLGSITYLLLNAFND